MADEDFSTADSGAALSEPVQCSSLRKGDYCLIKGKPCKIVDMSTSKTGKHGHAKVHLVALEAFTGKKYEDICPSTHNMQKPFVKRTEYTLVNMDDDYFSLMDDIGEVRDDIKCDLSDPCNVKIKEDFEDGKELIVTVLTAMGSEKVISSKTSTAK